MSRPPTRVAAIDLGATSVRVAVVDLSADQPNPHVVHRVPHEVVAQPDGTQRWDWDHIVAAVEHGLELALADGPIASIGVDGWAVDYGLLDRDGALLSPPISYRDTRTAGWERVAAGIGEDRLYELTGIQLMPINTIFQLAAHDPDELSRAHRLLLLPDLLVAHLTGHHGTERSNASTTALLDTQGRHWVPELLEEIGVHAELFAPLQDAGVRAGTWRGVPVHIVGSHDTASAFIARPGIPDPGSVVISSGTWVLVGLERAEVDVSSEARAANFSNERGALGGVRFLKNVMGFWLLERCRSAWGSPPIETLIADAMRSQGPVPIFDATEDRFLSPPDMEVTIRDAAGLGSDADRATLVRSILESIAAAAADVVLQLEAITGTPSTDLHLVGGGVRMEAMNRLLAEHTGLPVVVGSAEATSIGNAALQGLALGRFSSLDDARSWIGLGARRFEP
jgi:rhamnulokinase